MSGDVFAVEIQDLRWRVARQAERIATLEADLEEVRAERDILAGEVLP